ncbi:MAG: hypothetical protein LPK09_04710 [Hymenobacteraceae bacterium]|nr:hypothetical protein [Hymenobacteraceae bacterium]
MKKPIYLLLAAGLFTFTFASCDSPQENRAEERAEEMEDAAEERADEMEDMADDMDDDTTVVVQ